MEQNCLKELYKDVEERMKYHGEPVIVQLVTQLPNSELGIQYVGAVNSDLKISERVDKINKDYNLIEAKIYRGKTSLAKCDATGELLECGYHDSIDKKNYSSITNSIEAIGEKETAKRLINKDLYEIIFPDVMDVEEGGAVFLERGIKVIME